MFSWLRSRHHDRENIRSDIRVEARHHSGRDSRSEVQENAPTSSVPRERYPPPSYESAVIADQARTSTSDTAETVPPANTPPPAWNDETPPPSYEDATDDRPRHVRSGNTNVRALNNPTLATDFLNARGSNASRNLNLTLNGGISIARQRGANGSTVHSVTIGGRNYGGIQVGSISGAGHGSALHNVTISGHNNGGIQIAGGISGAEINIGAGGISIHSRRNDDRGNTVTYNFFRARGSTLSNTDGGSIGGTGSFATSFSRAETRTRMSHRTSGAWRESDDNSSDGENSDEDERCYGRDGNGGGL